jgi:para-aminobenzoate synthetase component 1
VEAEICVIEKYDEDSLRVHSCSRHDEEKYTHRRFCLIPYSYGSPIQKILFNVESSRLIQRKEIQPFESQSFKLIPCISKSDYIKTVRLLKNEIQQGNIYEINYCIEFYADNVDIDPLSVFVKLDKLTRAPYSKLVKIDNDHIISASPELFLKKLGTTLYTKPIKGTVKRGKDKGEDEKLKSDLQKNIKERTENVMAVDVARNDLSRIAKRGTVKVNKLYNIETFETVHQMVSTVSCEIKNNTSFDEIIQATFPMASMTGAPKVKATELIDATECFKRNFYSGAMGFIEENGDLELSVNIRSIFYNSQTKHLSIAVGSAITHLCDPEQEYDECLLKAGALLKALNATIGEL